MLILLSAASEATAQADLTHAFYYNGVGRLLQVQNMLDAALSNGSRDLENIGDWA